MALFAAKVYASVRSGSLAIIASTLDSLLDLLSGFILWFTAFSMQTPNPYRYPIGKKRMQPLVSLAYELFNLLSILFFSFLTLKMLIIKPSEKHVSSESRMDQLLNKVCNIKYKYLMCSFILRSQGILVFASVMATLGLQIILESVRILISDVSHFIITSKSFSLEN